MVRYDKFFGGIAQDDRLQGTGQYTYGQNLNIRKGKWVELENGVEIIGSGASPVPANVYISSTFVKSALVWYCGTSDGRVFYTSDGGVNFTTKVDTGTASPIIDIVELKDNLYFFTTLKTFVRTTYTDVSAWVMGGNVTTISTLTVASARQNVIIGNNIIFYIEGTTVKKATSLTPTVAATYGSSFSVPFSVQNQIVGLSLHGNTMWLYEDSGKMYCLDNTSEEVIGFKDFKENIVAARNLGPYDVVVTQSVANNAFVRSWVMNTGVAPESSQLIRRYRYSDTVRQSSPGQLWGNRFGYDKKGATDFSFADCEGILYWSASDQGKPVIYSFGKTDNVLPEAVTIISNADNSGVTWEEIKGMWIADGYLIISQVIATRNYIKKIKLYDSATTVYPLTGYLITKVDDFGIYEVPKTLKQVLLGADIPTGTSIKLEYSINEGLFVEYKTITNTDAIGVNGKKYEFSTPIEMFNEIAWRITLITTNTTITPKVYSFTHQIEQTIYEKSE